MKFTILLALLPAVALANLSPRQSATPACLISCLAQLSVQAASTGCGPTDIACLCNSQQAISGLVTCIRGTCAESDLAGATAAGIETCQSAGVTPIIPGVNDGTTSAAASGSATSAEASTTATTEPASASPAATTAVEAAVSSSVASVVASAVGSASVSATGARSAASAAASNASSAVSKASSAVSVAASKATSAAASATTSAKSAADKNTVYKGLVGLVFGAVGIVAAL